MLSSEREVDIIHTEPIIVKLPLDIQVDRGPSRGPPEIYFIKDQNANMFGPFSSSNLALWAEYKFIGPDTMIFDSQTHIETKYSEIIVDSHEIQVATPHLTESFLWSESKSPFSSLVNRIGKCLLSRQSKDTPVLSISSPNPQVTVGNIQDFEVYLEQPKKISNEIMDLHLNSYAQPFAQWVMKSLADINCPLVPAELLSLLLETDYNKVSSFIAERITNENVCKRFLNAYAQWRVFIPVYIEK